MVKDKVISIEIDENKNNLYVETEVKLKNGNTISSIIENTHSNLTNIILNGDISLYNSQYNESLSDDHYYEKKLKDSSMGELIKMAKSIDDKDIEYIKK